jgi:hypothetical protein
MRYLELIPMSEVVLRMLEGQPCTRNIVKAYARSVYCSSEATKYGYGHQ